MEADTKVIRLIRKAVVEKPEETNSLDNSQSYFATDYFDIMQVEQKTLQTPVAELLDIGRVNFCVHEAAAQSYALYCSSRMLEKYELTEKNEREYRANPFEKIQGMEYLSIIHVYITPEIISRMDFNTEQLWNQKIIMEPFVDDIYQILDKFKNDHPDEEFVARLYIMLSAGDFAIVVKSKKPETSFDISTYLRKRVAGKKNETGQTSGYVIYKTYTLLTIGNQVVYRGDHGEKEDGKENCFILRGCYSNIFWKEQNKILEFKKSLGGDIDGIYPISGRYDFTVQLNEKEFFEVMPGIVRNSETEESQEEQEIEASEIAVIEGQMIESQQSNAVKYIKYLLDGKYLSYINERYLMVKQSTDIPDEGQEFVSTQIVLSDEGIKMADLYDRNQKQIQELLDKQEMIYKNFDVIQGYRKQMKQYLFFLKRQILLCKNINELSDTRIYAKVIAEQLNVVLSSVEKFLKFDDVINGEGKALNLLENNLRKSLWTLDSYAQYIRNNNLQSLQTPNYNIETSMGMEKILIGYSEFLWRFMEFYQQKKQNEKEMQPVKSYLPIMVPNLHNREVSVEILFPERKKYCIQIDGSREKNKYLMVVGSSTMEEASDIAVMITSLFHEVAHQFRYEPRKKRNDVLLRPAVNEVMEQVAKYVTNAIDNAIGTAVDATGALHEGLTNCMTEAFIRSKYYKDIPASEMICQQITANTKVEANHLANKYAREYNNEDEYLYEFQNASLENFQSLLAEDINDFFELWTKESHLKSRVKEYITEIRCGVILDEGKYQSEMQKLNGLLEGYDNEEGLRDVIQWAFQMAWICAYQCLSDEDKTGRAERWDEKQADLSHGIFWEAEWDKNFSLPANGKNTEYKSIGRIWHAFYYFERWLKRNMGSLVSEDLLRKGEITKFDTEFYDSMKQYWDDRMIQSEDLHDTYSLHISTDKIKDTQEIPFYRYWSLVGRYLGLDYGAGKEKRLIQIVKNIIKNIIRQNEDDKPLTSLTFVKWYREETADLFMCNIVPMEEIGYLNLVAFQMIQNNTHVELDIKRFFCVLYVHWCWNNTQAKSPWEAYRDLCCSLFQKTRENLLQVLKEYKTGDGQEMFRKISSVDHSFQWKEDDEKSVAFCIECIQKETASVREIVDRLKDDKNKEGLTQLVLDYAENILRIFDILKELIQGGAHMRSYWESHEEVMKDLIYGDQDLQKLRYEMEGETDSFIRKLVEVTNHIADFMNRSYSQRGIIENAEMNRGCIELLLSMYYNNKIRIAQDVRGG